MSDSGLSVTEKDRKTLYLFLHLSFTHTHTCNSAFLSAVFPDEGQWNSEVILWNRGVSHEDPEGQRETRRTDWRTTVLSHNKILAQTRKLFSHYHRTQYIVHTMTHKSLTNMMRRKSVFAVSHCNRLEWHRKTVSDWQNCLAALVPGVLFTPFILYKLYSLLYPTLTLHLNLPNTEISLVYYV